MKKLLMIALITMFAIVACKKETPTPPKQLPDVMITATSTVCIDTPGRFTATLSEVAKSNIMIKVINSHPELMEVTAETIIIEKGKTIGNLDFTGKAVGTTKVSFSSADATVKPDGLTVTMILPIVD